MRLCIDFMIEKLKSIGFNFRKINIGKSKTGVDKLRLSICRRDGIEDFYKYIGECNMSCFEYKWEVKNAVCCRVRISSTRR